MNELYRKYHAGRYDNQPKQEPPKEKGKFLNEVEKKTKPGSDAGKLRDKTRKALEEMGL